MVGFETVTAVGKNKGGHLAGRHTGKQVGKWALWTNPWVWALPALLHKQTKVLLIMGSNT